MTRSRIHVLLSLLVLAAAVIFGCAHRPRSAAGDASPLAIGQPDVADDKGKMQTPSAVAGWSEFHGEADDLVAAFPSSVAPRRVNDSVRTPIGSQAIVRFVGCDFEQEFDAGYLIRTSSPLALLAGEKRILDAACDGTAAHLGGTVRASTACEVDGHAARDIEITLPADDAHPDGRCAVARLIITDTRIYHAIVRNVTDLESASRARSFMLALHPVGS